MRALTFVVNRAHERYIVGYPIDQVTPLIYTGEGVLGTSRAYFEVMLRTLAAMDVRDAGMERLRCAILARG